MVLGVLRNDCGNPSHSERVTVWYATNFKEVTINYERHGRVVINLSWSVIEDYALNGM